MELGPWRCDNCKQVIERAEKGWVEWLIEITDFSNDHSKMHGLRLVHNTEMCQYNQAKIEAGVMNSHLQDYLGSDGLMELLEFLDDEELPREEVMEMIKRLHIPGYEQARKHFTPAISEGIFEPNSKPGFYTQQEIETVIEWAKEEYS